MLGISALAQLPLAGFPGVYSGLLAGGHAWRRLLATTDVGAILNRDAPEWMVWAKADEEAILLATIF